MRDTADVCLIVEGAYPFVSGGVSAWIHALLEAQSHLRFAIVAIVPDQIERKVVYRFPDNVVSFDVISLHLRTPARAPVKNNVGHTLLHASLTFQRDGRLDQLASVLSILAPFGRTKIPADFLDSEQVWRAIEDVARAEMPHTSFLHLFWSLRSLLSAFLSSMLAPLPDARVYHAISTGYAGLMAARARVERGRPALLTEHGIYTNERRIEIASADWLHDKYNYGISLDNKQRALKDIWTDCFGAYARATYAASELIITLFGGNQEIQIRDGAPPAKCLVIPNGIDCEVFGRLKRPGGNHPPTIALIGRVVPIKDVKTYLRAVAILKDRIPDLRALVIGPTDEDPGYYAECVQLSQELDLAKTLQFTGRVSLVDYLSNIHVNVLTSLSEAQPLAILEAGAAGVPTVASDVGACREMICGMTGETPPLGAGGAISAIGDSVATADAIAELLTNHKAREGAAEAMRMRVIRYYSKARMDESYRDLYESLFAVTPRALTNATSGEG